MRHDVFISHAADNKLVADAMLEKLEEEGIRCWIAPRDIRPGDSWGGAIVRAIETSKILVLIFSSKSNASHQVLREVERAVQKDVVLLPFRIEDITPSVDMEYFLSTTQWLDALSANLEEHFEILADTVNLILDHRDDKLDVSQVIADKNSDTVTAEEKKEEKKKAVTVKDGTSQDAEKLTSVSDEVDEKHGIDKEPHYQDAELPHTSLLPDRQEKTPGELEGDNGEEQVLIRDSKEETTELSPTDDAVDSVLTDADSDAEEPSSEGIFLQEDSPKENPADKIKAEELNPEQEVQRPSSGLAAKDNGEKESQTLKNQSDMRSSDGLVLPEGSGKQRDRKALQKEEARSETKDRDSADLVLDNRYVRESAPAGKTKRGRGMLWVVFVVLLAAGGYAYQMSDLPSFSALKKSALINDPLLNDKAGQELQDGEATANDPIAEQSKKEIDSAAHVDATQVVQQSSQQSAKRVPLEQENKTEDATAKIADAQQRARDEEQARREAEQRKAIAQKKLTTLTQQAEQGSTQSMLELVDMYAYGDGVSKNLTTSANWLKKAAEQGLAKAQYRLSVLYRNGDGVPKDLAESLRWLTQAADQGYIDALNELGLRYEKGNGVEQDYRKAFERYNAAAQLGDPDGQRSLGIFYEFGLGVNQDLSKALQWYRTAAAQGDAKADLFRQDLEAKLQ